MIGLLPLAQAMLAIHQMYLGRFRDAATTATEGRWLATTSARRTASRISRASWPWRWPSRGESRTAASSPSGRSRTSPPIRWLNGSSVAEWALGLLDLGQGRFEAALERFETAARGPLRHQIMPVYFAPDQIEAAVRLGLPARAAQPLARFESWATAARHPWADAVLHRCRALLAHDDEEADGIGGGPYKRTPTRTGRSNGPAPTCTTARGCAAPAARPSPGPACAPRWRPSNASAPTHGPNGPAPSCAQRARP